MFNAVLRSHEFRPIANQYYVHNKSRSYHSFYFQKDQTSSRSCLKCCKGFSTTLHTWFYQMKFLKGYCTHAFPPSSTFPDGPLLAWEKQSNLSSHKNKALTATPYVLPLCPCMRIVALDCTSPLASKCSYHQPLSTLMDKVNRRPWSCHQELHHLLGSM